jgi:hypothetical protein
MTYIYFGNKIDLATFITAGILIGKVRTPTDKLLAVNSRIKSLDQTMTRMHKVLMLDEVQTNLIEYDAVSKDDLSVSIHGNFSWKLGEKDVDPTDLEEQVPF